MQWFNETAFASNSRIDFRPTRLLTQNEAYSIVYMNTTGQLEHTDQLRLI